MHVNDRDGAVFVLAASFIGGTDIGIHTWVVVDFQQPGLSLRIEQNVETKNLVTGACKDRVLLGVVRVHGIGIELHHVCEDGESARACHLNIMLNCLHKLKIIDLLQFLIKRS